MSPFLLALIGIVVGIVTNRNKVLGSPAFNFTLAATVTAYIPLSRYVSTFPPLSEGLIVFLYAYIFGTFVEKLLRKRKW